MRRTTRRDAASASIGGSSIRAATSFAAAGSTRSSAVRNRRLRADNRARVIPKPRPGGLDPQSIVDAFALRMMYSVARDQYNATDLDSYQALAFSVRDRLMERWFATQDKYYQSDVKRVYYLSLEFLLGRLLMSNALNLGAAGAYRAAMMRLGFDLEDLAACEPDAGLGNGGLGRLAACFLDSAS